MQPNRSYREMAPRPEESRRDYCARLEKEGHEEMFVRKALRAHFGMQIGEFGEFFEDFEDARFRHIDVLLQIVPSRSDYSLVVKLSRNLGISRESAVRWVKRYRDRQAPVPTDRN